MTSPKSSSNVADDVGSVSALRLALQLLSERCERLQCRLDQVEKENVTIKGRCTCHHQLVDGDQTAQINLKELSCKKQQLVEYLRIVTDENRTLWSKLSALDDSAAHSNDKIKPKNSLAINYLKHNSKNVTLFTTFNLINYTLNNNAKTLNLCIKFLFSF